MTSGNDRLVLAAHIVSEGAWMFAILSIFGLWFGLERSPLAWAAVMAIMGISLISARTLNLIAMPAAVAGLTQMALGVVVLFFTLGAQIPTGESGMNLGWIGQINTSAGEDDNTRWGIVAGAFAVYLWWRGGRIAGSENAAESLATSFKAGVLALSPAIIVDIANEADLNVFPMMFVFFGAGLAGLSFGNLLPTFQAPSGTTTWPRVIGGIVAGVLVIGLAFSLLRESALQTIAAPFLWLLKGLGTVAFYVAVPFVYVMTFIVQGIFAVIGLFSSDNETEFDLSGPIGFDLLERPEADPPAYMAIIGWAIVGLIVLGALLLLARAFRRRKRWRLLESSIVRESIREDADVGRDLAQLLLGLLPDRFKRRRASPRFRLPEGRPDVVDVFRIYYGLLALAEENGIPRPTSQTPAEYQRTLEQTFPASLVRWSTAAFIRARYGNHGAERREIDEMRLSLDRLIAGAD